MYKSDKLNQTDYATDRGLFRLGDQRWPNRAELQVRDEVLDPFAYARTLDGFHAESFVRQVGRRSLDCFAIERDGAGVHGPTQYCFEKDTPKLRYVRGFGWYQTAYNDVVAFQGRNVGRQVVVTDGGKAYLKMSVLKLEQATVSATDFIPPSDAVALAGQRVTGVPMTATTIVPPEWSARLRDKHFSVTVEVVVGRDGHVISAHAISGESSAFTDAERTARRWVFKPFLLSGDPVEVGTKIILSNN